MLSQKLFNLFNRGIWRSSISLPAKVQLYHTCIQPVLLCGSDTWALRRALQDKVDVFEHMCLRRILRIPYTDYITTATVRLQAGSPPQLSQLIQARWLRFFGHVAMMDTSLDITRALKVQSEGCPRIEDDHLVVLVIPGYVPWKQIYNLLTLASTQHRNTLRIENGVTKHRIARTALLADANGG